MTDGHDHDLPLGYKTRRPLDGEAPWWCRWVLEKIVFDPPPPMFFPFRFIAVWTAYHDQRGNR